MASAPAVSFIAALMGQAAPHADGIDPTVAALAPEGSCVMHVTTFTAFAPGVRDQGPLGGAGDAIVNGLIHGGRKEAYRKMLATVLDGDFQARSIDRGYLQAITGVVDGTTPIVVHEGTSTSTVGNPSAAASEGSCRMDFSIDDVSMTSTATWTGIRVKGTLRGAGSGRSSTDFSRTVIAGLHLFEQRTAADRAEAVEDLQAAFRLALTMIRDKAPAWKERSARR